jgi:hypothetical protein
MSDNFDKLLAVLSKHRTYTIPGNRVMSYGNARAHDAALLEFFSRFGYRTQTLPYASADRMFMVLNIDGRRVLALNTDPSAPNSSNYFYIKPGVLAYIRNFLEAGATIALFDTSFCGGEFTIRLMNHLDLASFTNRCRGSYYTTQYLYFKYNKNTFAKVQEIKVEPIVASNYTTGPTIISGNVKAYSVKSDPPVPESVKVLQECADLQLKKSIDYQNPNSKVKQAMHYRHGVDTIYDIMHGKMLRIQSLLEAKTDNPNFESLEDSFKDLINYGSFAVSYLRGKMDGQS